MNDLSINQQGSICQIALNRPLQRNNLNAKTCQALTQALVQADQNADIHCIVLHGDESIFCSGVSLEELMNRSEEASVAFNNLMLTLIDLKKPILAAVRGPAVGLGVAVLLLCDMVYCGKSSMFSVPATALGLTPEHGLTTLLTQRLGYHKACEKLLLSEPFSAGEAAQMDIVNAIFDDEHVLEQTLARAQRLCRLPLGSLMATKQLMRLSLKEQLLQTLKKESSTFLARQHSAEAQEAFTAFREGRQPDFSQITP